MMQATGNSVTSPSFWAVSSTASGTSHRGKVRLVVLLGIYGLAWWIPYQGGQGLDRMMATAGVILYNNYSSTNATSREDRNDEQEELKIQSNIASSSTGIPTHTTTSTNTSSNKVVVEPAMLLQAKIEVLELEKQVLERKILEQEQNNHSSASITTANADHQQQLDSIKLQMQQLQLKEKNLKQWEKKLATLQQELEKDKEELKKLELQTKAQTLKKKDSDQQAGACMLIMDDNHLLIEWIAYHYHTLPLRRLIVLSDPDSRTTPQPILDRWEGRINVTVWNESRIFPRGTPRYSPPNPMRTYLLRQQIFISQCIHTLTQEGDVSWVLNTDTDEYLMVNDRVYDKNDRMYGLNVTSDPLELPSPSEPGYVLKFIQQTIAYVHKFGTQNNRYLEPFQTPCLGLSRKQFGTYEDEKQNADDKNKDPPFPFEKFQQGIQPSDLGTWRWRYWGSGVIGKTLIHLPRLNKQDVPGHSSVHRPILREDICSKRSAWAGEHSMPLVANHYPATLEQGLFRTNDSRSKHNPNYRKERYEKERLVRKYHEPHSHILEWVNGFVNDVGLLEATRLLQYAGNVTTANAGTFLELENTTTTSQT